MTKKLIRNSFAEDVETDSNFV